MNVLLSTIAPDCPETAKAHGLGIEIAQFCTAYNMDQHFPQADQEVRRQIDSVSELVLHGPFNELFPCAIDPLARKLAAYRYRQAIDLAKGYGAKKVVIHGGYNPRIYFEQWYVEQSIVFWKEFMAGHDDVEIVLENVLEPEPDWICDIINAVDHPKFRMCLDIGHVNAYSEKSVFAWLERCAPYISHFHIHNNDRSWDTHSGLDQGSIPMVQFLHQAQSLCPAATYTLEVLEARPAALWLKENHFI